MSLQSDPSFSTQHSQSHSRVMRTSSDSLMRWMRTHSLFTKTSLVTKTLQDVPSWLEDCVSGHANCTNEVDLQSSLRNLKVIDCFTRTIVGAPQACEYVALSYVWGTNQTVSSLDSELPQTIEDAIKVVLALGRRYLWVDRYVRLHSTLLNGRPKLMKRNSVSSTIPIRSMIKSSKWAPYTSVRMSL